MADGPIQIDVDAEIKRLERGIEEQQSELAFLKRLRARKAAELAASQSERPTPSNGSNPAFAPKGEKSGREASIEFLREVGDFRQFAEIHRAALDRRADITYGALHSIITDDMKKPAGVFISGEKRGSVGLREWGKEPRVSPRPRPKLKGFFARGQGAVITEG